jgi:hydrogenase maturation protein HypF
VTQPECRHVRVTGVVQGVGFRPFVYVLATGLGLTGHVGNDSAGVFIEVEGRPDVIEEFCRRLVDESPPLAHIESVTAETGEAIGRHGFEIVASVHVDGSLTLVSADMAPCRECLAEMNDPGDRRFRYPFLNCTNCGPRFTITRSVPYDRPGTTMAGFPMCDECLTEYRNPHDRRFHAQPTACPRCGPRLTVHPPRSGDPIEWRGRWWPPMVWWRSRASAVSTWPAGRTPTTPWPDCADVSSGPTSRWR